MRGIGYNHEIWNTRSTVLYDKLYLQRKDYLPPTPNTEFICIISLYGSITNRQITCNLKVPTSSFQLASIHRYHRINFKHYLFRPNPASRATLQNSKRESREGKKKKKKIAKNNKNCKKNHDSIVLSLLDRRTYKYIYIYILFHCYTRETRVNKLSIRGWSTTMKDCRISRRARPFCWLLPRGSLVRPLSPYSPLSRLSAYLRPTSNMRISRRKLQLSLKSYATGVV